MLCFLALHLGFHALFAPPCRITMLLAPWLGEKRCLASLLRMQFVQSKTWGAPPCSSLAREAMLSNVSVRGVVLSVPNLWSPDFKLPSRSVVFFFCPPELSFYVNALPKQYILCALAVHSSSLFNGHYLCNTFFPSAMKTARKRGPSSAPVEMIYWISMFAV